MHGYPMRSLTIGAATLALTMAEDCDPDTSYLEQPEFADRLAEYRAGAFGYVGIIASIRVNGRIVGQDALWGIEYGGSAVDNAYAASIARDVAKCAADDARQWFAQLTQRPA